MKDLLRKQILELSKFGIKVSLNVDSKIDENNIDNYIKSISLSNVIIPIENGKTDFVLDELIKVVEHVKEK